MKDLAAAFSSAIVGFPIAITLGIASNATPAHGLYATIIGGFIATCFGGANFSITGPAAVFLLPTLEIIRLHGLEGLYLATGSAGLLLMLGGWLNLGRFIHFIPYSVILGFTSGLAMIILTVQAKDCLGLSVPTCQGGSQVLYYWHYYFSHWQDIHVPTACVSATTVSLILLFRNRVRGPLPFFVIVIIAATIILTLLGFDLSTIGKKYGEIHLAMPDLGLPSWSCSMLWDLLPHIGVLTFLGALNALLSSAVSEEMTQVPDNPRSELIGQGIANVTISFVGAIRLRAGVSRTITNIKAEAQTSKASLMHTLFVLGFASIFAPWIAYVPICMLSSILFVIGLDMANWKRWQHFARSHEYWVVLTTFVLTLFCRDFAVGIVSGFAITTLLFLYRMGESTKLGESRPVPSVLVYHITGPFFFGAANRLKKQLVPVAVDVIILDSDCVSFVDSTGVRVVSQFVGRCRQMGVEVILTNPALWAKWDALQDCNMVATLQEALEEPKTGLRSA